MESAVHQMASASVAAVFSISMLLAAHLFSEYRSSRSFAMATAPAATLPVRASLPLDVGSAGPLAARWRHGAI